MDQPASPRGSPTRRQPLVKVGDRVKVSKQVVFQKVGDGMVLLHMRTGVYYGLNPTGARLWELLKEKKSLHGALAELMTDYYDVKPEDLRRDAMRLVRRLQAKGLIEVVAT